MKKNLSLIIICLFTALLSFSQRNTAPNKISKLPVSYAVEMPLKLDSTDLNDKKFDYKNLLSTFIRLPKVENFTDEVKADVTYDYFFLPKLQGSARFQFLHFRLTTDRFTKIKLKVTSPGMFELYDDDGKTLITKSSVEDSLKLAQVMTKELSLVPGTSDYIIKYLTLPSNKASEGVKISVETDSINNIKVGNDNKRYIKIQDIIGGTRLVSTNISPNGQFIVLNYKAVSKDGKANTYSELLNLKTNKRVYLGTNNVNWMPKTNYLYYTQKRVDNLQLIGVDPENQSEIILSDNIPSGSFVFTPDEKNLIFSIKESGSERKDDLIRLQSPEDRQPGYNDRYFIHKFNLENGLQQRLFFGKNSTYLNDISSDSRYILFSTHKETVAESPFSKSSMFLLDMQTMQLDTLWIDDAYASSASFSPDAKQVLILGAANAFNNIGVNLKEGTIANSFDMQAYIMNIATKQIDPITKSFNPSVNKAYWNEIDKMIYLNVVDKDKETVYRYNPNNKSFTLLNLSEDVINNFSLADNSLFASYSGSSVSNPKRGYLLDLKTLKSTLIDDLYQTELAKLQLGKVDDWNFTSSDGTVISGRYYLPPNFDSSKKYPMIVYYYGGTTPVARTFDYPYPMHVYAALGYVVYVVQPSGAIGFGQDFSARHVNAWGKRTANEIIEGTKKFINEHSFVDSSKVGCIGASYGGFMTMYLQTQTDIFAAAISHAGISSIASYWGEGYWGYTYSSVASAGSYPWNNKEMYIEQSPLFNADKIKTPILLLHGMEDTNVPIGESIQIYTALKVLGRPVEFIQVKNENHSIMDYNRRLQWNYSIDAWFAKWLQNDSSWWDSLYPEKK